MGEILMAFSEKKVESQKAKTYYIEINVGGQNGRQTAMCSRLYSWKTEKIE